MDIPRSEELLQTPYEGFSLERSTSFSKENNTASSSDRSKEALPSQRHVRQVYSPEVDQMLNKPHIVATNFKHHTAGFLHTPLERKPFVFEKDGEQKTYRDHIDEITSKIWLSDSSHQG